MRGMGICAIDHVQLAIPRGGEDTARAFYGQEHGLCEFAKPPELAGRGGVWLESGSVKTHVGVDAAFRPARKAHPAMLVDRTCCIGESRPARSAG